MSRRFILAYLPGNKINPWRHSEAFVTQFHKIFGQPTMANFEKLAVRMQCSEDTIRRLYNGQDGDRHVFPKAQVLAELEMALELAPGSLGAQFSVIPPPQASEVGQVEGTMTFAAPPAAGQAVLVEAQQAQAPVGPADMSALPCPLGAGKTRRSDMPLGSELEPPTPVNQSGFYRVNLREDFPNIPWRERLLTCLPVGLIEASARGEFPVYVEQISGAVRVTNLFVHEAYPELPQAQVFKGLLGEKVQTRLTNPVDATFVGLQLRTHYAELERQAVALAREGAFKVDDVLGRFRAGIGDLCRINDELKVLQVDAEDLASDPATKDPRVGYIAKRLRTQRLAISTLLRHSFPDPQVPKQ